MNLETAVTKAVNDCIMQGILKEFLTKNKARVIKMSIYEYDEKKQRRLDWEDGRQDGRAEGIAEGRAEGRIILIRKKVIKGKTLDCIADELESTVEEIRPLYEAVMQNPAETDPAKILSIVNDGLHR